MVFYLAENEYLPKSPWPRRKWRVSVKKLRTLPYTLIHLGPCMWATAYD